MTNLTLQGCLLPIGNQVEASLRNAWGTELLLALGGSLGADDELIRLMNNWAVVQAYYCCYHGAQALLAARSEPHLLAPDYP